MIINNNKHDCQRDTATTAKYIYVRIRWTTYPPSISFAIKLNPIWINPNQIQALLERGGIKSLSSKFVSNALRSNHNNDQSFLEKNKYSNINYYCFDPINKKYTAPKYQVAALKEASSEAEKESIQPTIPSDYFLTFELKHLRKYTNVSTQSNNTTRSPSNSTNTNTNKSTPTNVNTLSTNPLNSAYYLQTRQGGCGCAANNSTTCASHIVTPETNNTNTNITRRHNVCVMWYAADMIEWAQRWWLYGISDNYTDDNK